MLYPTKRPSQKAVLQRLSVGLVVHERPGPDHPKVPEVGILAVKRLVRRPVVQGRVWRPVAQEDSRLHQLPQTNVDRPESVGRQRTMFTIVRPARSFASIC